MCGILGVAGSDSVLSDRFGAALSTLAHRGPDGEVIWSDRGVTFGHRRLAIIDLSHAADQPMVDPISGAVLILNGEIYNYRELRQTLQGLGDEFRTASDTEVLLKAYLRWGAKTLSYLNGMFAFAIYDPSQRSIFLARDRFGVKPLYYAFARQALIFASEPKALLALEPALAEPDVRSIYDFLVHTRSFSGPHNFFSHIRSMPSGNYATYRLGDTSLSPVAYWEFPPHEPSSMGPARALEEFTRIFDSAVRLRLRSDVPVGVTLSGGLDSSAVLAGTVGEPLSDLKCFTSIYSDAERGEERWAKKAAGLAGRKVVSVLADTGDWYETLKKIIWHMDGPSFSPAVFPLWNVMKVAREQDVPVLLEGQGADELLAGYPQYMARHTAQLFRQALLRQCGVSSIINQLRGSAATFGTRSSRLWHLRLATGSLYGQFQERFGRHKLFVSGVTKSLSTRPLRELPTQGRDGLFRAMLRDFAADELPALLQYGDAVSMAHGIEARTPFMDYRLVDWVFRNQPPVVRDGMTKWPVRAYLEAKGFAEIAHRKDKKGYDVPISEWVKRQAPRIEEELFGDRNSQIWSYLNIKAVRTLFDSSLKNHSAQQTFHLHKILTLDIWLKNLKSSRSVTTIRKTHAKQLGGQEVHNES